MATVQVQNVRSVIWTRFKKCCWTLWVALQINAVTSFYWDTLIFLVFSLSFSPADYQSKTHIQIFIPSSNDILHNGVVVGGGILEYEPSVCLRFWVLSRSWAEVLCKKTGWLSSRLRLVRSCTLRIWLYYLNSWSFCDQTCFDDLL